MNRFSDNVSKKGPHLVEKKCSGIKTTQLQTLNGQFNELGYELLPHSPYAADLAPNDHFLFPNLRRSSTETDLILRMKSSLKQKHILRTSYGVWSSMEITSKNNIFFVSKSNFIRKGKGLLNCLVSGQLFAVFTTLFNHILCTTKQDKKCTTTFKVFYSVCLKFLIIVNRLWGKVKNWRLKTFTLIKIKHYIIGFETVTIFCFHMTCFNFY